MSTPQWPKQITVSLPPSDPASAVIAAWIATWPARERSAAARARLAEALTLHAALAEIRDHLVAIQDRLDHLETRGVAPPGPTTDPTHGPDTHDVGPVDAATLAALLDFSGGE